MKVVCGTCSCSYHVHEDGFESVLEAAAVDAGAAVTVVDTLPAGTTFVSVDGGTTWSTVWRKTSSERGPLTVVLDLTVLAAQQAQVQAQQHPGVLEGGATGPAVVPGGVVVYYDVSEEPLEGFNKFIPYYLYPEARFVVGLSALPRRLKISVGSNPWLPRPALSIAAICGASASLVCPLRRALFCS